MDYVMFVDVVNARLEVSDVIFTSETASAYSATCSP